MDQEERGKNDHDGRAFPQESFLHKILLGWESPHDEDPALGNLHSSLVLPGGGKGNEVKRRVLI